MPAVGCLPELVDERVGILYNQKQSGALQTALLAIQQRDLKATSQAAYQRAQALDWEMIAQQTVQAYRR